jgi:hypothetical protein
MRKVMELLGPEHVDGIQIVEASATSWMVLAVMKEGTDRRFRYQDGTLYDERFVGDHRIVTA